MQNSQPIHPPTVSVPAQQQKVEQRNCCYYLLIGTINGIATTCALEYSQTRQFANEAVLIGATIGAVTGTTYFAIEKLLGKQKFLGNSINFVASATVGMLTFLTKFNPLIDQRNLHLGEAAEALIEQRKIIGLGLAGAGLITWITEKTPVSSLVNCISRCFCCCCNKKPVVEKQA